MRSHTTVNVVRAYSHTRPEHPRLPATWLLVVVSAICLVLFVTPWGIGTSPDSAGYIHQARALSAGGGLAELGTQWPPLYPLALAATTVFAGDPLAGGRWLNALLFAGNVALLAALLARTVGNRWLASGGVLLLLTAAPMLTVHAYAWSEALFLWLGFSGLAVLERYLRAAQGRLLLLAAGLLALAALTRYAGLPFILTGMLAIVLFAEMPLPARIRTSVRFGLVSSLPLLLWLGWSFLQSGTAGNRELAFHPIGRAHIWQAIFTVTGWLQLPAATPGVVRLLVLAILLLGSAMVTAIWWRRRDVHQVPAVQPCMVWLLALFVPVYLAFLALTISFLDANTPLDDRILAPIYVAVLFLALTGLGAALLMAKRRQAVRVAILGGLGVVMLVQLASAASWVHTHRQLGLGYSSPAWQQSETIAAVSTLPPEVVVFSNAPEVIDLVAQREALSLPRKHAAMRGEMNAGYEDEVAAVQRALAKGAVIVYFDALANRPVASPDELAERMALTRLSRLSDGMIFGAGK